MKSKANSYKKPSTLKEYLDRNAVNESREKVFSAARSKLPDIEIDKLRSGSNIIQVFLSCGERIPFQVAVDILYDYGYNNAEARLVIWLGLGERKYEFDADYNIISPHITR